MTELVLTNIQKRLGHLSVLKGVSLTLSQGEIVTLLGHSGSGKTTLLRSVAGLELPEVGTITLDGQPLLDCAKGINVPTDQRGLGFVFQSYALWPHRTVYDNVAYGLILRKMPKAEVKDRVAETLDRIGLSGYQDRFPHQMSGGQQQRVALARALVYRPPVLLLDEPLSNLDAKLREEARSWLRELIQQFNLSALYVTHDQVEAMAVSDRVLFLRNGQIEQQGTPQNIYLAPATALTADFMGTNNVLTGTISQSSNRHVISGDGWKLEGQARAPLTDACAASAFIRVERTRLSDTACDNAFEAELVRSLFLGERYEYILKIAGTTLRAWGAEAREPGRVWIAAQPEDIWLFPA